MKRHCIVDAQWWTLHLGNALQILSAPFVGFACGALYHGLFFGDWSGFTIVMGLFMGFPAGVGVMVLFLVIHYWQSKRKRQGRK